MVTENHPAEDYKINKGLNHDSWELLFASTRRE